MLKKITIWLCAVSFVVFTLFIGFGYYLEQTKPVCVPFQTHFLGKAITFPMTLEEATKKYNLTNDGITGWSVAQNDSLLIVDTRHKSKELYGIVFYLREMSMNNIDTLKKSLEAQYDIKFKRTALYPAFQYEKISSCTYLLIYYDYSTVNGIFRNFVKTKITSGERIITCRVGFYHDISEKALVNTSFDGEIGVLPYHRGRAL
jgi:hypothetical protein